MFSTRIISCLVCETGVKVLLYVETGVLGSSLSAVRIEAQCEESRRQQLESHTEASDC